jgi:Thioesterase domain
MRRRYLFIAIGLLSIGMMLTLGSSPGMAQPRAHVYLLRGLLNIFSLGMDTLAEELNNRGVYATVDNHTAWQSLADQAAAKYKAGAEGPIILIGHSLGANAVMEMAAYLGEKGVPVALVVPFDAAGSYYAASNVARVVNLTQRNYAYMRRGPGFHGSLDNVDVSSDPSIDHLNIDKSPRLHARVISEVLAVVGGHRMAAPGTPKPAPSSGKGRATPEATPAAPVAPAKSGGGAMNSTAITRPVAESGTPVIALPETRGTPASSPAPVTSPPPRKPVAAPQPATASQISD